MNKQFREKIKLAHGLNPHQIEVAVEYARVLGFQSEAAVFPVTSFEEGTPVPEELDALSGMQPETVPVELPDGYVAASDSAKPIIDFDWREKRGLEKMLSKGSILKDNNLDQLPDEMDVHFVLADTNDCIVAAAVNLAFRYGMETTAYKGRLVSDEEYGNCIVFKSAEECSIMQEEKEDGVRIVISGNGDELVDFAAAFCEHFPKQGCFDTWTDKLLEIAEGFRMQTLDGQLAALNTVGDAEAVVFADPDVEARRDELEKAFPNASFVNYKDDELSYESEYDIEWEIDTLRRYLEDKVYPKVASGDRVELKIAVSEDKEVRAEVKSEIEKKLREKGASDIDVRVLCSYKQGYSWIDEAILPELKGRCVKKFEVSFKPFLPPGETVWSDEDGAIPHYNNVGGDPNKWYDMPIRYLQELYPIEDAIVAATGIDGDDVVFKTYEGEEDITYLVKVYGENEELLFEDTYKSACSERPYIDAYPDMGKVHPSTGYLKAFVNGEAVADERVESDVEKIWDVFQLESLPELRAYVDKKTEGQDLLKAQPFFGRMQIDIDASEPNEALPSREDLFSTLDALHEDLYFVGTDYFKNYGTEKQGVLTDAPGLILPKIRKRYGKPSMKVSVYGRKADEPYVKTAEKEIRNSFGKKDVNVWLRGFRQKGDELTAHVRVEGVSDEFVANYAELCDKGILEISASVYGCDKIVFETENAAYEAVLRKPETEKPEIDVNSIDISEFDLIGYDRCMEIMEQMKGVKGINVFRTTKSYTGREHYAIEFKPNREGYISRTKRITAYPTELIICRHHANEVSSTNEAFMLIRKLLTEDKYKDLTENMNLVIIPMDNVDGSAIHYELQKENPTWKLHVARFNAIGKEFYHEHFKPETIHTEAYGMRRVFMEFLPDFLIDNHGVPSHEWEQQFAGYTSPSFRGFWLPRSLLYGYFYHIAGEEYESNITLNKQMEDVIANDYLDNEEVTRENKLWARQFEKYAHRWMPKMFPANYYKNMINYWIPHEYDPGHRYPSVRFPWILSFDYVSEVADETAQGEYLNRCARAHLAHDLAIIGAVTEANKVYKESWSYSDEEVGAELTRKRPVFI